LVTTRGGDWNIQNGNKWKNEEMEKGSRAGKKKERYLAGEKIQKQKKLRAKAENHMKSTAGRGPKNTAVKQGKKTDPDEKTKKKKSPQGGVGNYLTG